MKKEVTAMSIKNVFWKIKASRLSRKAKGECFIGNHFRFGSSLKMLVPKKCKFSCGKNCLIRDNVRLETFDRGAIIFGDNVFINNNTSIVSKDCITIGNHVLIAQNCVIVDHDHLKTDNINYSSSQITIGDNVWIGANCVILQGTTIGNGSIIAAGSVIKGNIPCNSVVIQKRVNTIKNK